MFLCIFMLCTIYCLWSLCKVFIPFFLETQSFNHDIDTGVSQVLLIGIGHRCDSTTGCLKNQSNHIASDENYGVCARAKSGNVLPIDNDDFSKANIDGSCEKGWCNREANKVSEDKRGVWLARSQMKALGFGIGPERMRIYTVKNRPYLIERWPCKQHPWVWAKLLRPSIEEREVAVSPAAVVESRFVTSSLVREALVVQLLTRVWQCDETRPICDSK